MADPPRLACCPPALSIHHSSFPPLPAFGLGDGAKPPENRQSLPVAALHQLWQDGAGMNESEKQFSFIRAGPSTSGRAENQIPISSALALDQLTSLSTSSMFSGTLSLEHNIPHGGW
jgi:hypothetical protein